MLTKAHKIFFTNKAYKKYLTVPHKKHLPEAFKIALKLARLCGNSASLFNLGHREVSASLIFFCPQGLSNMCVKSTMQSQG